MRIDPSRAIGGYAAAMTLAAAWLGLAAVAPATTKFDTIDVQRINIREPDGTLRLAISNHALIPGIILGGKEYPHPGRTEAGMIFYNDQGDENGGLVFDGGLKNGTATNGGSLTFDRYRQDQTLQLVSLENGKDRKVGIVVNDRPDRALDVEAGFRARDMKSGPERDALIAKAGLTNARRAWLGRSEDGSVSLVLSDLQGRPRLTLGVDKDGRPGVELRDAMGKVTRTIR